jgi:hypothetical protein
MCPFLSSQWRTDVPVVSIAASGESRKKTVTLHTSPSKARAECGLIIEKTGGNNFITGLPSGIVPCCAAGERSITPESSTHDNSRRPATIMPSSRNWILDRIVSNLHFPMSNAPMLRIFAPQKFMRPEGFDHATPQAKDGALLRNFSTPIGWRLFRVRHPARTA